MTQSTVNPATPPTPEGELTVPLPDETTAAPEASATASPAGETTTVGAPAEVAEPPASPTKTWTGRRVARAAIGTVVIGVQLAVVVGLGWLMVAVVGGTTRMGPVLSGSMGEAAPEGSLVIATRVPTMDLEAGDILLFNPPDTPDTVIIHRILEVDRTDGITQVTTKGDANQSIDSWAPMTISGSESWVYQRHFAQAGAALVWINQNVLTFLGIVFGSLVVLNLGLWLTRPREPKPS